MTRRERILFEIGLFVLGVFLGVALSCAAYIGTAEAEDGQIGYCWVMIKPKTSDGKQNEVMILRIDSVDDETENYIGIDDEDILQKVFDIFKDRYRDEFDFE